MVIKLLCEVPVCEILKRKSFVSPEKLAFIFLKVIQYDSVYGLIGCIIDQSNWPGPFSLMVMTPDFYPRDRGSRSSLAGCFYLQVYISPPTS